MNNPFGRTVNRYAMGMGKNPLFQGIADTGAALALGAGGQQLVNMTTGGADPNPLLSGAFMAPALTALGRTGRFYAGPRDSDMRNINDGLLNGQFANPISAAVTIGSAASLIGGGATSLYNNVAGGVDVDPNYAAASLALLGGIAPLAMKLLS